MTIVKAWDRFWFHGKDLRYVSLFRFLIGLLFFTMYFIRFLDRDVLMYEDGLVNFQLSQEYLPEFYRSSLIWVPATDHAVFIFNVLYLAGLALLALGVFDCIFSWFLLVLHLGLVHRNFTIMYGPELIATFWLAYLGFIRHGRYFSIWNCWRARRWTPEAFVGWDKPRIAPDLLSAMGVRLLQIQLCVIYGFTGLEKLRGTAWWNGSAVWRVLGNAQLAPMDFGFLSRFTIPLALMTFATVLFEIYFPVMVWIPQTRKGWLALGLAFHLGAAFTMGLPFFSLLMIFSYLVFF